MPYWDWALVPSDGSAPFMDEFGWEDITIYGPNGLQDISNPLYSYHFGEREMLDVRSTQVRSPHSALTVLQWQWQVLI